MKRLRVLLADDHVLIVEALAMLICEYHDLVGVATDGAELLKMVRETAPDVVIADLSMPVMNGLECLKQIRAEGLCSKVLILSMHNEASLASEALRAGASGYILKHSASEELLAAIQDAFTGRIYLSLQIAEEVLEALARPGPSGFDKLSSRQKEVLRLVATGRTMKEIAAALRLSPRTIETHKYEMMQVLGVHTTAELIQFAVKHDDL